MCGKRSGREPCVGCCEVVVREASWSYGLFSCKATVRGVGGRKRIMTSYV